MPSLPDLDDDDTGPIATAAAQETSDPARALRVLGVRMESHERADARRFRLVAWLLTVILGAAVAGGSIAWAQQASTVRESARLEDVIDRLGRIESQIDRLVERSGR